MEKKIHNWPGYICVAIYIFVFIILLALTRIYQPDEYGILFGLDVIWFIAILVLIPKSYRITAYYALPEKTTLAKIIAKCPMVEKRFVRSMYIYNTLLFLTFEFPDGARKDFQVTREIYNITFENEIGLLTYKEQDKYRFFVRFKRNKF